MSNAADNKGSQEGLLPGTTTDRTNEEQPLQHAEGAVGSSSPPDSLRNLLGVGLVGRSTAATAPNISLASILDEAVAVAESLSSDMQRHQQQQQQQQKSHEHKAADENDGAKQ